MKIGIPKESQFGEKRVSASPKSVATLLKMGFDIQIEDQAGFAANFSNQAYQDQGAEIVDNATAWQADLVFKVNAPNDEEISKLKTDATLVSFIAPAQNEELLKKLENYNH